MAVDVLEFNHSFIEIDEDEGPAPPFTYNCLHDLESVWWTAIYTLFLSHPETFKETEDHAYLRRQHTNSIFPGNGNVGVRAIFLVNSFNAFTTRTGWMSVELKKVKGTLKKVAQRITALYHAQGATFERANGYAIDHLKVKVVPGDSPPAAYPGGQSAAEVHEQFERLYEEARLASGKITLEYFGAKPSGATLE